MHMCGVGNSQEGRATQAEKENIKISGGGGGVLMASEAGAGGEQQGARGQGSADHTGCGAPIGY